MMATFRNGKLYGTIWERNGRHRGTVQVVRLEDGSLVVVRSDLDGEFERLTGFRTVKQAIEEAKCYA